MRMREFIYTDIGLIQSVVDAASVFSSESKGYETKLCRSEGRKETEGKAKRREAKTEDSCGVSINYLFPRNQMFSFSDLNILFRLIREPNNDTQSIYPFNFAV